MDLHQICTAQIWCKHVFAPEQACSRRRKCHIWYIVCTPVYLRESVGVVLFKRTHYAQRNSMLSRFDYFLPFVVEGFSAVHYNKRFPNYFQFFFFQNQNSRPYALLLLFGNEGSEMRTLAFSLRWNSEKMEWSTDMLRIFGVFRFSTMRK